MMPIPYDIHLGILASRDPEGTPLVLHICDSIGCS